MIRRWGTFVDAGSRCRRASGSRGSGEGLTVVGPTADAPTGVQYRYTGLVEHRVTQYELKAWRRLLIGWSHVACKGRDHYRARIVWRASKAGTESVAGSTRQMGDKQYFGDAISLRRRPYKRGFGSRLQVVSVLMRRTTETDSINFRTVVDALSRELRSGAFRVPRVSSMSPRFPLGVEAERLARSNTAPGAVVTGRMSMPEDYRQCRDWLLRCISQVTSITGFQHTVDSHWRPISSRVCFPAVDWTVGNLPDLPLPRTLDEAAFVADYLAAVADMEGVADTTDVVGQ